ncbi:MAG TPA: hypothetical protein VHD83_03255 [Puia sp.]|nr:hypothetical protein [Puia sp.]
MALWSCSKSGGGSKPKVSIQSISNPIQPDQDLDVDLKFTNGSNLSGGWLIVIRTRVNQIPPINTLGGDTIVAQLPTYSGTDKGELEFTQPYQGYLHYDDHINDTLVFKFAVIDANGNKSDTISSPKVVAISL